ncbi:acylphosphatase [Pyrodictium occultum]|uniref:Acylphosphatase n=1 Tax=Pyrodictium occultum TaxID=2309 RepID=A0A0V8RVL8_PYROC|nr:acylphosphatase [Pyrodictium occultum]KSW12094.1 acylphosphatase [Pyrodictium occultum]
MAGGMARAYLRIYGRVQGVFFRATMREVARRLGVTGWVRNMPDGSVEAVVEGPREAVEEVIRWAHRGPPAARVERVVVVWEPYRGEYRDFTIRYDLEPYRPTPLQEEG